MKYWLSVSSRGLVTLPAKLRKDVGIEADDALLAEITSEGILLRPCVTLPIEMYSDRRVDEFDGAERELAQALDGLKHG